MGCSPTRPSLAEYPFGNLTGPLSKHEVRFYRQRCQQHPQSWLDQALLAQSLVAQAAGDPKVMPEARDWAHRSLKLRPNPEAQLALTRLALLEEHFTEALALATPFGQQSEFLEAKIQARMGLGQLEQATPEMARLLQLDNNSLESLLLAAQLSGLRGRDDVAWQLLLSARSKEQPQQRLASAHLRYLWGDLHWRHLRVQQAEEMFKACLAIQPSHALALEALAEMEQLQGHPDQAAAYLSQAQAFRPQPRRLLALAELESEPQEADRLRRLARPGLSGANLARYHYAQGKLPEALACLSPLQQAPWTTWRLRAQIQRKLGQQQAALQDYSRALATGIVEGHLLEEALGLAQELASPLAESWRKRRASL